MIPFIDAVRYHHSLKDTAADIPVQVCITKDNVQVHVDGVLYLKVLTWVILLGSAAFDCLLYLWVKDVIVCYRCHAHHRRVAAGVPAQVAAKVSARELYDVTGLQQLPFNTLYQLVSEGDRLDVAHTSQARK